MMLQMLKGKIHRATVTDADLDYEGSMAIDEILMKAAGIIPNERIEIYSVTTGNRFATYAIKAPAGSGTISVNGAAARLAARGDIVIICAYAGMEPEQAAQWHPSVVRVDAANKQLA